MKRLRLAPPHRKLHSDRVVTELPNQIDERIEQQVVREAWFVVPCRNGSIQRKRDRHWQRKGVPPWADESSSRAPSSLGIAGGGEVGFIDLGDAALIVPGGVAASRSELRRVLEHRYDVGLASIADPELADQ
jgi:hypothetical protein